MQDESDLIYGPDTQVGGSALIGILEKWNIAQGKIRVDDILK